MIGGVLLGGYIGDFSATVEMTGGGLFEFSLEIATLTLAMT